MRENNKLAAKFENTSKQGSMVSMTTANSLHSGQNFHVRPKDKGTKDRVSMKDIETHTQQSSNQTSPETKMIPVPAMFPN